MPIGYLIAGLALLLLGAYFYDEWTWRKKPREALVGLVLAPEWRLHPKAMSELRRRGEELSGFLPRFLPLLGDESRNERVAAEMILRKFYPQVARELEGYSPMADPETCREKLAPLLAKYAVGDAR